MRRRMLVLAACAALLALCGTPRAQEEPAEPPKSAELPTVTIFTDGLADPGSRASQVLRELAIGVDRSKLLRVLAVMGYGGERNARELLQGLAGGGGRGDFSVLNSDILAYLSLINAHHEAREKLRLVAALFPQRILLFGRNGISSFQELAGKRIAMLGPEATTGITAHTVFGLAQVPASFVWVDESGPIEADGAVVLEGDAARWLPRLAASGGYRLVPLPLSGALAQVYRPATLGPADAPGFTEGAGVATLKLETLLAAANRASEHPRHADMTRFIEGFFGLLPRLHKRFPGSVWGRLDIRAPAPGWRRFAFAATVSPAAPPGQEVTPAEPAGGERREPAAPVSPRLRLVVTSMPTLAGAALPGGGVVAELAAAVLAEAASGGDAAAVAWAPDRQAAIEAAAADGVAASADAGPMAIAAVEATACGEPNGAGADALCEGALLSDAIYDLPLALILPEGSRFDLASEATAVGHALCAPADAPLPRLTDAQRHWIAERRLGLVHAPTLADCAALLQRRQVDALLTSEIEARLLLMRLGPANGMRIASAPFPARRIHLALPKTPPAATLLPRINAAIASLRRDGRHAAILARHRELSAEAPAR